MLINFCQFRKIREGAPKAVFWLLGVNRILVRFLEMFPYPQNQIASSLFWSAKRDWGFGGKGTSANLTAIQVSLR